MKKIAVAVDADDVIFDFLPKWELCLSRLKKDIRLHSKVWDFKERYNVSQEDVNNAWSLFNEEKHWENLDLIKGSYDGISNLISAGFDVHIVTSLDPKYHDMRLKNLEMHNIKDVKLHCVGHFGCKKDKLIEINAVALFDDAHVNHMAAYKAGVEYRFLIGDRLRLEPDNKHTHAYPCLYSAASFFVNEFSKTKVMQNKNRL